MCDLPGPVCPNCLLVWPSNPPCWWIRLGQWIFWWLYAIYPLWSRMPDLFNLVTKWSVYHIICIWFLAWRLWLNEPSEGEEHLEMKGGCLSQGMTLSTCLWIVWWRFADRHRQKVRLFGLGRSFFWRIFHLNWWCVLLQFPWTQPVTSPWQLELSGDRRYVFLPAADEKKRGDLGKPLLCSCRWYFWSQNKQ